MWLYHYIHKSLGTSSLVKYRKIATMTLPSTRIIDDAYLTDIALCRALPYLFIVTPNICSCGIRTSTTQLDNFHLTWSADEARTRVIPRVTSEGPHCCGHSRRCKDREDEWTHNEEALCFGWKIWSIWIIHNFRAGLAHWWLKYTGIYRKFASRQFPP